MNWFLHNVVADLYGPYFLLFYAIAIGAMIVACYKSVRSVDRTRDMEPPQVPAKLDPYEIAYLRGGANEVTRVAVASDRWPWDRVVQFHFAGGHWHDGSLIDSHSQPIPPEVWNAMEAAVERASVRGIILERDENLPPFAELLDDLERARTIGRRHGRWA
jgi:Protein of unknown function (DUF692)